MPRFRSRRHPHRASCREARHPGARGRRSGPDFRRTARGASRVRGTGRRCCRQPGLTPQTTPDGPVSRKRPLARAQALRELVAPAHVDGRTAGRREVLAARVAEIRLGRAQAHPVRFGFDARSDRGDEVTLDAQQLLQETLRLLVVFLAEMVVADHAVPVDEVQRRPVVIVERGPHPEPVVDRDRVVDSPDRHGLPDLVDVVPEGELRRVHSDYHEAVLAVGLRPCADEGLGAQPVDAGQCPEVHQDNVPPQLGGVERPGVEPPRRSVKGRNECRRGHVSCLLGLVVDPRPTMIT